MSYLQFIAAFLLLAGIALLWGHLLRGSIGEGMVLSVLTVIGMMYLTGYAHAFRVGIALLSVVGIGGWVIHGICLGRSRSGNVVQKEHVVTDQRPKSTTRESLTTYATSPYLLAAFFLVCLYLVLYYKDFIQHIDEFHLWAPAVRYMLQKNALPLGEASYDARQLIGTSFFHVYFQYFTGYSEAFMYVSATLLTFLGFLLPFGQICRSEELRERVVAYKKVGLYMILMILAVYTLYMYGLKNLYVDMPCAAWAGGLAAWWTTRTPGKKRNLPVLLAGMVLVYLFKSQVGALLVLFLVLWVALWSFFVEGRYESWGDAGQKRFWKVALCCIAVVFVVAAVLVVLPPTRRMLITWLKTRRNDVTTIKQMLVRFTTAVFGKQLSSRGNLPVSFASGLALVLALFWAESEIAGQRKRRFFTIGYTLLIIAGYLLVLLYAYVAIFSAEESVKVSGIARYLSIPLIYLLVPAVSFLFSQWQTKAGGVGEERRGYAALASGADANLEEGLAVGNSVISDGRKVISGRRAKTLLIALTVFFSLGLDESFIPSMTGMDKPHISGYTDLHAAKEQVKVIQTIIDENDKVYMLNQVGSTEYPVNVASYELEGQVNNYLVEPWCFTEAGCKIRLRETDEIIIEDFPQLLSEGGYTYLWIYTTDEYLTENLPEVLTMDEEPADGQLYQIVKDEMGTAVGLELVKAL